MTFFYLLHTFVYFLETVKIHKTPILNIMIKSYPGIVASPPPFLSPLLFSSDVGYVNVIIGIVPS